MIAVLGWRAAWALAVTRGAGPRVASQGTVAETYSAARADASGTNVAVAVQKWERFVNGTMIAVLGRAGWALAVTRGAGAAGPIKKPWLCLFLFSCMLCSDVAGRVRAQSTHFTFSKFASLSPKQQGSRLVLVKP